MPTTSPLFTHGDRRAIAKALLAKIDEAKAEHERQAAIEAAAEEADRYRASVRKYLAKHVTPETWRGRRDEYHFNRLMAGLIRVGRSRRMKVRVYIDGWTKMPVRGGGLPRILLAEFLREHIKKNHAVGRADVAKAIRWFRLLSIDNQRAYAGFRRSEEAARKRDERMLARWNKKYADLIRSYTAASGADDSAE